MAPSPRRSPGFALVEVIVVLVIASIITIALLSGLIALVRGLQPQRVTLSGETLAIAPTFGSFAAAIQLNQNFTERLSSARAVYVFGGLHLGIPPTAAAAQLRPLQQEGLPRIETFSRGLPLDAKGFYDAYAGALGLQEVDRSSQDFSIAVVGAHAGALAVTCFVQVRRRTAAVPDVEASPPYVVREVKLWDVDGSVQRYTFAERPSLSSAIFVGAVHTWLRFHADGTAEEGPACVALPDPWVYGGSRGGSDDIPPFSRFGYVLAVSP